MNDWLLGLAGLLVLWIVFGVPGALVIGFPLSQFLEALQPWVLRNMGPIKKLAGISGGPSCQRRQGFDRTEAFSVRVAL